MEWGKMEYDCSKEKGGKYFCHKTENKMPIKGTHGSKRAVLKKTAELNGIPLAQYMKFHKKAIS